MAAIGRSLVFAPDTLQIGRKHKLRLVFSPQSAPSQAQGKL